MQYTKQTANIYSRKRIVEQKNNVKKAILFTFGSILVVVLLVVFGIPAVSNLLGVLTDIKQSNTPSQIDDTTPPITPRFDPIQKHTNKNELEITGRTEPGATVFLLFNDKNSEVLANSEGSFRSTANLTEGENTLYAYAKDTSGNQSDNSTTILILYDKTPPMIEILKPTNNSEFVGPKERQLTIEGKSEENAKVTINGRHVFVENDGSYSYTISLSEGENKFIVRAEDEAGNSTDKEFVVRFSP